MSKKNLTSIIFTNSSLCYYQLVIKDHIQFLEKMQCFKKEGQPPWLQWEFFPGKIQNIKYNMILKWIGHFKLAKDLYQQKKA